LKRDAQDQLKLQRGVSNKDHVTWNHMTTTPANPGTLKGDDMHIQTNRGLTRGIRSLIRQLRTSKFTAGAA
jgi:hypothetical protein